MPGSLASEGHKRRTSFVVASSDRRAFPSATNSTLAAPPHVHRCGMEHAGGFTRLDVPDAQAVADSRPAPLIGDRQEPAIRAERRIDRA